MKSTVLKLVSLICICDMYMDVYMSVNGCLCPWKNCITSVISNRNEMIPSLKSTVLKLVFRMCIYRYVLPGIS